MGVEPLTRRSALRGAVIGLAAAVVGFAVARAGRATVLEPTTAANGYGPAPTGGGLLARLDQVPAGGGLILDRDKIVLTRGAGNTVHGFSAICTHQGCPVAQVSGGAIICPCHGSRFDAQTGAVVGGPASRPLPPVAGVVRDGNIYTS